MQKETQSSTPDFSLPEYQKLFSVLPGALLPWYRKNARDLPWRHTKEPYRVWVSEIMLQQTRVEAVRGYYSRFLAALPDVSALAAAEEDDLLKLWQGLGYYSRAKNLQKAARMIVASGGEFPTGYEAVRALPGIGDYTADAVCSICFNLKTPAVDGNVLRVVSRLAALECPMDAPPVKAAVRRALCAVCPADAGAFTQSLMELGATVCLPGGKPNCAACPMESSCAAHAAGRELCYPVRTKKNPRRKDTLTVFLLMLPDGRIALQKRPEKGLLAGLYELPNLLGRLSPQQALDQAAAWGVQPSEFCGSAEHKHSFTHVEWHMTCYRILCRAEGALEFHHPNEVPLPSAFAPFTGKTEYTELS